MTCDLRLVPICILADTLKIDQETSLLYFGKEVGSRDECALISASKMLISANSRTQHIIQATSITNIQGHIMVKCVSRNVGVVPAFRNKAIEHRLPVWAS